ncbi:MAG: hypothetical protein ACLSUW_04035 [Akkermansia sp.]
MPTKPSILLQHLSPPIQAQMSFCLQALKMMPYLDSSTFGNTRVEPNA